MTLFHAKLALSYEDT